MKVGKRKIGYGILAGLCIIALVGLGVFFWSGRGQKPPQQPRAVEVKALEVQPQKVAVPYEFVGEVKAKNEVQLRATVSGNLSGRLVNGGAMVSEGQPLFTVDTRQYQTNYYTAQAGVAQAEASLSRAQRDLARYESLAAQQAIAQQVVDNSRTEVSQAEAQVEAARMRLQQASNDLGDTTVKAPMSGKIDMKDTSIGTYVRAGDTVLATLSSLDPVQVQFSVSEADYLKFSRQGMGDLVKWQSGVKLRLSDGSIYPEEGKIEQVDRGLSQDTGSLLVKATFPNPSHVLVPGMFGRVLASGEERQNVILIPERAVQESLGKTFVTVVGEEDKAESRPVVMGAHIGQDWVVESGLKAGDKVIVEGFMKTPPGTPLKVNLLPKEQFVLGGQK